MAMWTAIISVAIFGIIVDAVPTIAFPINSQVPPVARIGEPFSYTFSESTFSSSLPMTYTLSNAPQWLFIDNNTRTLSGTPSASDVGTTAVTGVNVDLSAADQSGSVTLNTTLVISTNPAPVINIPLTAQLALLGTSSLPSTLLYHPSTNFNFRFDPGTFSASGLNHYSVTQDNTPLPSWIQFDGNSLSFSGRTPDYESLIQPPQTFGIQVIASDVEGFSGVSIPFEIEVGVHLLAFKNADMAINATAGVAINFDGLQNNLELDGEVIVPTNLASIIVQAPTWIAFDNSTFLLSGTVPPDAVSSNVTVQATDIYGDTDSATIFINTSAAIFLSQIGILNATAGSPFSFNISSYLRNVTDVEMTAQFSPMTSWVDFDSQTLILSGSVPSTAPDSRITVDLEATLKSSHASASQTFALLVVSGESAPISSTLSNSQSPSSTNTRSPSTDTSIPSGLQSHRGLRSGVIVAIVVPISLLVVAVILAFICCYRRRAAKKRPRSPAKSDISGPVEVTPSIEEVIRPTRIVPPEPLQLDTSGFTTDLSTSAYTNEGKRGSSRLTDNPMRRSQTMSAVSGQLKADFRQSDSTRARSYSENVLSKTDRSWRSTQDSAYPTISSTSRTNSSHRLTRNYSRKGQNRRSGRLKARDSGLRDSTLSMQRPQSTILNLGDSSFSFTPLDNFSALSKRASKQHPSEIGNSLQRSNSAKRKSRFGAGIEQRSGVGHGGRESIASLGGVPSKRRSIGHGQNWESVGLPRDSRAWLTVNSRTREQDRSSNVSAITENTDVLDDCVAPLSLRTKGTTRAPIISACLSDGSSTRPVSRRTVRSSPFFAGGGSMRSSRKSRSRQRTSYADSPTVPEEDMVADADNRPLEGLQEESTVPRDSFGISYGAARGGTRQLRSYIQSRLNRAETSDSTKSSESRDSRFESADSLPQSQPNFIVHARTPNVNSRQPVEEGLYEEFLPDDFSDGSWETQHSPARDSMGNIIEYGLGEAPEVATAVAQRHTLATGTGTALGSHPASILPPDIGPNARMVKGKGKRPLSVDASVNKGSVRAVVESDYTAYI